MNSNQEIIEIKETNIIQRPMVGKKRGPRVMTPQKLRIVAMLKAMNDEDADRIYNFILTIPIVQKNIEYNLSRIVNKRAYTKRVPILYLNEAME